MTRILPPLPPFVPPSAEAAPLHLELPQLLKPRPAAALPAGQPPAKVATLPHDRVDPAYRKKAEEAAIKFESFFISQLLRGMRRTVVEVAAEDSPYKSQINQDMLDIADVQVADKLAQLRSFGIADAILKQILPDVPKQLPSATIDLPARKSS